MIHYIRPIKNIWEGPLHMLTYPVYYHDKNQEVWLTLNPCCYGKYAKRHKIFQSHFLKMATVTLSNFKWPQLQYFLDDSLHLNTKIISRIYIFENYISQNTKKIVGTVSCEWVTNGVRHQASHSREQRIATYLLVGTLMAQSPKTSHGWASLSSKMQPPSIKDSAAFTVSTSILTMEVEAVTPAIHWIASRGDRPHMPSSS